MMEDDFVFKNRTSEDAHFFTQSFFYRQKSICGGSPDLRVTVFYNDEAVTFNFLTTETVDKCVRRFLKEVHIKSGIRSCSIFSSYRIRSY
jgi:hypothetical protein